MFDTVYGCDVGLALRYHSQAIEVTSTDLHLGEELFAGSERSDQCAQCIVTRLGVAVVDDASCPFQIGAIAGDGIMPDDDHAAIIRPAASWRRVAGCCDQCDLAAKPVRERIAAGLAQEKIMPR